MASVTKRIHVRFFLGSTEDSLKQCMVERQEASHYLVKRAHMESWLRIKIVNLLGDIQADISVDAIFSLLMQYKKIIIGGTEFAGITLEDWKG